MIKINSAKNVFGIKTLTGADTFGTLNVVYSPNGTAKSSIADVIKNVSVGDSIEDVYGSGLVPTYEFDIDGTIYNETNMIPFNVLKYCGVDSFELNESNDYSDLVVSPSAKKALSTSITSINNSLSKIEHILLSSFSKKGKGKAKKFSSNLLDSLSIIAGSEENITLNFALNFKTSSKQLGESLTEEEVLTLVSSKGKEVIQKPEVYKSIADYASVINSKTKGIIVDTSFNIEKLNTFKKHIIDDGYFDDKNKRILNINGDNVDKSRFLEMVEQENLNIYGTDDVKKELDKCKESMNKNAGFATFSNMLLSKPALIKHALDYETFANEVIVTFLGTANVKSIEDEIINIKKEQATIASLRSSLTGDDNVLHDIWERFKNRFKFKKYDLEIKNKFDALTGNELPRFIKCQPGTDKEITDPSALRFSTGEIRSFNLINFIIEVERMLLKSDNFTIVLDDAVDSFDYKNKYGIIDYLVGIKDKPNVQMIVLTHNFDFYRSIVLAFGKRNTNQYFMYKDKDSNVTLYDVKSKGYYLSVTDFNGWKNPSSDKKYLSFIPFLRNVLQLENNSQHSDVLDTDKYLHYEIGVSDSLDFTVIEPLMKKLNFLLPPSINSSDKYLSILDSAANTIASLPIVETDLENKIVLGLYIRIYLERFLSLRILNRRGTAPLPSSDYARTSSLINQANNSGYLSKEELSVVVEANVISPSYIHANSFMYEPLIDVETSTLIDVANKIRTLNSGV